MPDNTPRQVKSVALTADEKKLIFLVHFEANGAKITAAAREADTTISTVYRWMSEDEDFHAAVQEARDSRIAERLDVAEDMLDFNIMRGMSTDIQFLLKTLGKHRGYGSKVALTGPDGESLFKDLKWPDEPEDIDAWERQVIDAEIVEPPQLKETNEQDS